MTNKELAQKLLDLLGGKDNVLANAACMTRLRVTVKDTATSTRRVLRRSTA